MDGAAMGEECRGRLFTSGHSLTLGLPSVLGVDEGQAVRIAYGTPTTVRIEPGKAPRRKSDIYKVADFVADRTLDPDRMLDHAAALAFTRPLFGRASYDRPMVTHPPFPGVALVVVNETGRAGFSGLRVEDGTRPA